MGTPPSGLREWCATTSASIRTRGRRCPRRRAARSPCPSRSPRAEAGAGTDKPTTTVRCRRHCVRNRGGVRMEDVAPAGGGPHAAPRDAKLIHGRSVRRPPRPPLLYRCNLVRTPQLRTRNRCARIAARLQHLLYVSTAQRVLLPDRMASTLRSLRSGSALVGIVDSEEGRTHMKREHRSLIVWPSVIAAGLLAAACTDQPKVSMAPNRPAFWMVPPPAQCPTGKWTGGGRIDPPSNPDTPDEAVHPEYFAVVRPSMTGKFTFGFNVFLGQDAAGNCIVNKGEIEVNGHAQKIAWHVAIHDGVDAYDGRPVH